VRGNATCADCPAGQHQDEKGQGGCKDCDGFHFWQDLQGEPLCKDARVCVTSVTDDVETEHETAATTATSNRVCEKHTICQDRQWEITYAGSHNQRVCEIRQPCHHTFCKLHKGQIVVRHHKKDHNYGFTHHHCKFDTEEMRCRCMCHNQELDSTFAYKPEQRFFWKKSYVQMDVAVATDCADPQGYSPSGSTAPDAGTEALSLCQADTLGQRVVLTEGGVFAPGSFNATGADALGSGLVIFQNDKLSWMGEGATCASTTENREAAVYTCVQEECPHPKCCDCGNELCTAGGGDASTPSLGAGNGQCRVTDVIRPGTVVRSSVV